MKDLFVEVLDSEKGIVVDKISINSTKEKKKTSLIHFPIAYRCQLSTERLSKKKFYESRKSRGEVSGGGRKPYKQKGTGRARQGSIRAPQWKGGGVVFGPNGDQRHSLTLNKKSKQKALTEIIIRKLIDKEIKVVREIVLENYKTKYSITFLKELYKECWKPGKTFVIILSTHENKEELLTKAFNNLSNVEITDSGFLSITKIMSTNFLLFTEKSFKEVLVRTRTTSFSNSDQNF